MPSGSQHRSQISSQASDIGSGRTNSAKMEFRGGPAEDFERLDEYLHGRHSNVDAPACQPMCPDSRYLLCRVSRRNLLEVAEKRSHCFSNLFAGHLDRAGLTRRISVGIASGCVLPQPDSARVFLWRSRDEPHQTRRFSNCDRKNSGRHRVERAKMTHLRRIEPLPYAGDDIVRGDAGRFVDDKKSDRRHGGIVRI